MRPSSSNSLNALATDDWFGIVIMRIQRPSTRSWLTALNDCEPPETCITASVLPCVGRTAPTRQRNPVDLRLHDAGHGAVALRASTRPALRPERPGSRSSCTLGCVVGRAVGQRQAGRVEDPHLAAHRGRAGAPPRRSAGGCRSARAASRTAAGSAARGRRRRARPPASARVGELEQRRRRAPGTSGQVEHGASPRRRRPRRLPS